MKIAHLDFVSDDRSGVVPSADYDLEAAVLDASRHRLQQYVGVVTGHDVEGDGVLGRRDYVVLVLVVLSVVWRMERVDVL